MNINHELKKYIENNIFPSYKKNDLGHNLDHIKYVIDRSLKFVNNVDNVNYDMVYVIAAYHDIGHYVDAKNHEKVSADMLVEDMNLRNFFTEEEIKTMAEAIYDHRASLEGEPRSVYGKIVSSADRNTRIEIVFIRSFFVAHERMPETNIEEYLNYTIERLSKKYDEENPENMFFEDETYKVFIQDMRDLLKKEEEFKNRYCEVNHIVSRNNRVCDEQGEIAYTKILRKK